MLMQRSISRTTGTLARAVLRPSVRFFSVARPPILSRLNVHNCTALSPSKLQVPFVQVRNYGMFQDPIRSIISIHVLLLDSANFLSQQTLNRIGSHQIRFHQEIHLKNTGMHPLSLKALSLITMQ